MCTTHIVFCNACVYYRNLYMDSADKVSRLVRKRARTQGGKELVIPATPAIVSYTYSYQVAMCTQREHLTRVREFVLPQCSMEQSLRLRCPLGEWQMIIWPSNICSTSVQDQMDF